MPLKLNFETIRVIPGILLVVADEHMVQRIYFTSTLAGAKRRVKCDYPSASQRQGRISSLAIQQLKEYFNGQRSGFDLPLSKDGLSPFSQRVHCSLQRVPPGSTVSYSQLGMMAGTPRSARAVGRVMAMNPYPIVVPCHRVIRANGKLGEYSAANGVTTKRWVLNFEQGQLTKISR